MLFLVNEIVRLIIALGKITVRHVRETFCHVAQIQSGLDPRRHKRAYAKNAAFNHHFFTQVLEVAIERARMLRDLSNIVHAAQSRAREAYITQQVGL